MFWNAIPELDLCFGLLMLIVFGLVSLRHGHVSLPHIRFLCQCWLVTLTPMEVQDIALCVLTIVLLQSFRSFEALLFLLLAYIGQLYMMHSCNLVTFYVCLEAQTLCVVVLCGLLSRGSSAAGEPLRSASFSIEAALKFLLLSAMVSGMALFWFSAMYLRTGSLDMVGHETFWILLVMLFKLGVAPLHMWSVDLYGSIPKPLLMYLSTAPKLSLFTFWASSWSLSASGAGSSVSVGAFMLFSMLIGSIGAYGQPALRGLFAYSTINELGLLLMAVETAGFHTLYQHLGIYIITQLLLWNLSDKRLFALAAVSLAGLPPLAGFFGKAWIFWHAMNTQLFSLLAAALFCTVLSLVYYLRVIRLFWTVGPVATRSHWSGAVTSAGSSSTPVHTAAGLAYAPNQTTLTSACAVALGFLPILLVKPFVL